MRFLLLSALLLLVNFGKTQTPADAALCFYEWYFQAIKTQPIKAHTAVVKAGPNGETLLDYSTYLHKLDSLTCVSDTFKRAEVLRFETCQEFFKNVPYAVYYDQIDNDPFVYNLPCPFLTQYFWVSDMQPGSTLKVVDSQIDGKVAQVKLAFFTGGKKQQRLLNLQLFGADWKITAISLPLFY